MPNFIGNSSSNIWNATAGSDIFNANVGVLGGSVLGGIDTVSYLNATSAVNVNLLTNVGTGVWAAGDSYTGISNLTGSNFNDNLTGNNNINVILGGNGSDTIYGLGGNDTLDGGAGNDSLYGGDGADYINGGSGNDTAVYTTSGVGVIVNLLINFAAGGEAQGDSFNSIENLSGSNFYDILAADDNNNIIWGNDGDDLLNGRGGNDIIYGGSGNDQLYSGLGADKLYGDSGNDTANYMLSTSAVSVNLQNNINSGGDAAGDLLYNIENLRGSDFNDKLYGNAGNNSIDGSIGDDFIFGNAGNDYITDQSGNDFIDGGAGNDFISGGYGDDIMIGGKGNDIFRFEYFSIGNDIVKDFQIGFDLVQLTGGITFSDLSITYNGLNTAASYANQSMYFENAHLTSTDFFI
jgi:Ca2+-binding RTX toxin-like protein